MNHASAWRCSVVAGLALSMALNGGPEAARSPSGRQPPTETSADVVAITGVTVIDVLSGAKQAGVTVVTKGGVILPLRDRIRRGEASGPEIVAAGPMLDNAPADWPFRRRVTNAEEAREAVRDLKRRGVDFIKVHNNTPREVFFAIAEEQADAPR
jgi:hypothetical protein